MQGPDWFRDEWEGPAMTAVRGTKCGVSRRDEEYKGNGSFLI